MSKIKDAMLDEQAKKEQDLNKDLAWEHSQHTERVANCSECAKEEKKYRLSVLNVECEYGHMCTSACGRDRDCPCRSDHLCSASEETLEEAEATLDGHDCKLKEKGYCIECEVLENYRKREEAKYKCKDCKDTGIITKTEWHEDEHSEMSYEVEKPCHCQAD